jgi:hypothetical protein
MRFASKQEFLDDIEGAHATLMILLHTLPLARCEEPVWGDDWTVKDLIAHLTEWQRMLFRWFEEGSAGKKPVIPAPGYKYSEMPALNRAIQREHCHDDVHTVMKAFEASHRKVLRLVRSLSEAELLEPGAFEWTGKNPLTTYIGANTGSHYRFATKVLKRYLRQRGHPKVPQTQS